MDSLPKNLQYSQLPIWIIKTKAPGLLNPILTNQSRCDGALLRFAKTKDRHACLPRILDPRSELNSGNAAFVKVKRCHQYVFIIYLSHVPAKSILLLLSVDKHHQSEYPNLISRQRHLWLKRWMWWHPLMHRPQNTNKAVMSSWLQSTHAQEYKV